MKTTTTFAILLLLLSAGYPAAATTLRTVALSENTAPGTSDTFAGFSLPILNDTGQTAFLGGLNSSTGTNSGIWSEGGGSGLALVARAGSMAPGTSDNFANFEGLPPLLNDAGQTAFLGFFNSSIGIWSEGDGSGLALVARDGNAAPGTSDNFSFFELPPVFNDAGQTAFFGALNSSSATNSGIWSEGGGNGLALVARAGNLAPGTSDNFSFFGSFDRPVPKVFGTTI